MAVKKRNCDIRMDQKYTALFLISFSISIAKVGVAQDSSWLSPWEKSVVAIGQIDSIAAKSPLNKKVNKKFFKVVGTGVVFYVKLDTMVIPALVTAKHVFHAPEKRWAPDRLRLRFSWFQEKPVDEYLGISIELTKNGQRLWFAHEDSTVDLACYLILGVKGDPGTGKLPIMPYSQFAEPSDMFPGAQVLVLGYPGAVGMEFWTRAILRQGVISWASPNNPESKKILIDAEVYPGNSGGPVFKIPSGMDRNGGFRIGGKFSFLGIVSQRRFSVTPVKARGLDKITIGPGGPPLHSLESIGIAVVEPASRVRELLSQIQKQLQMLASK